MKKESLTTKKVVSLSEEKFSRMSEDELMSHVIEQLVTQTNQLTLLASDFSRRLNALEERHSSPSLTASSEEQEI